MELDKHTLKNFFKKKKVFDFFEKKRFINQAREFIFPEKSWKKLFKNKTTVLIGFTILAYLGKMAGLSEHMLEAGLVVACLPFFLRCLRYVSSTVFYTMDILEETSGFKEQNKYQILSHSLLIVEIINVMVLCMSYTYLIKS